MGVRTNQDAAWLCKCKTTVQSAFSRFCARLDTDVGPQEDKVPVADEDRHDISPQYRRLYVRAEQIEHTSLVVSGVFLDFARTEMALRLPLHLYLAAQKAWFAAHRSQKEWPDVWRESHTYGRLLSAFKTLNILP